MFYNELIPFSKRLAALLEINKQFTEKDLYFLHFCAAFKMLDQLMSTWPPMLTLKTITLSNLLKSEHKLTILLLNDANKRLGIHFI